MDIIKIIVVGLVFALLGTCLYVVSREYKDDADVSDLTGKPVTEADRELFED